MSMSAWEAIDAKIRNDVVKRLRSKLLDVLADEQDDYAEAPPESWQEPLEFLWADGASEFVVQLLREHGLPDEGDDFDAIFDHLETVFHQTAREILTTRYIDGESI